MTHEEYKALTHYWRKLDQELVALRDCRVQPEGTDFTEREANLLAELEPVERQLRDFGLMGADKNL